MCGRYYFDLDGNDTEIVELRKNIKQLDLFDFKIGEVFPSEKAIVLLRKEEKTSLAVKKWGMKTAHGKLLINARMEGIQQKRMFSPSLHQRCLIPCNGFYEWIKRGSKKDKIYVQKNDRHLLYLAGFYNEFDEFVIMTGESQGDMKNIHHRTPLILRVDEANAYLHHIKDPYIDNENLSFKKL